MQEPERKRLVDKMAEAIAEKRPNNTDNHDFRTLRRQIELLNEQIELLNKKRGKDGDKIHLLRCELAEVREITGKIERNHVRGLERQVASDAETIVELRQDLEKANDRNKALYEEYRVLSGKLLASERQHVVTDARA